MKAHQDDKKNRKKDKEGKCIPLTQPALLNIDYDERAEDQYGEENTPRSRVMPHSSIKTYFESNHIINTGKLLKQIITDRHGPKMRRYIKKKFKWLTEQFESVDWESAQAAFNQQTRISKAIYHWLPTMERLNKITPAAYPSPLCNTCKKTTETQDHIFTCGHHEARKQQINALKQMEREAKEAAINNFVIRTLTKGLHAWMHGLPPPKISPKKHPVHAIVKEAYEDQNRIGWNHALRGRLSKKWFEAQSLHVKTRPGALPPQRATLVRIIWKTMDN